MASPSLSPDQSPFEGVIDLSLEAQIAIPHLRHQSSLEGIFEVTDEKSTRLAANRRTNAEHRFYRIVRYFDTEQSRDKQSRDKRPYNHSRLVRYTFEYARSERSKDKVLKTFFDSLALSMDEDGEDEDSFEHVRPQFFNFADFLFDNLFLPLRASTLKTPQPSPAIDSAIQDAQGVRGVHTIPRTLARVSALRGVCLIRDRHRCVISRKFDQLEAIERSRIDGKHARDDDGGLLEENSAQFATLEVAHILPHSLTKTNAAGRLDPSKELAIKTLNMFDFGLKDLIEGSEIDRARNAITLTHDLHILFGNFQVFFEPVFNPYSNTYQPNTYRIDSFLPPFLSRGHGLPVTRTLYLTDNRIIDPPLRRLLELHSAIGHILHLSGAGEYIDKLFRDAEENGIQADGSTDLSRLLSVRLGRIIVA